jgi:xanthine dehydrogenase accessory factor
MSDLKAIVKAARAARGRNEDCSLLLATVVNVAGSSYRRIGARMLVADDRWVSGSVSGGCLEGDVVRKAWWCTRDGAPALLSYDSTDDDVGWGIGLGCNGQVELLVERCHRNDPDDPLAFLDACLTAEKPGALATVFRSSDPRIAVGARLRLKPDGELRSPFEDAALTASLGARAREAMATGRSQVHAEAGIEILVEAIVPPPHLYVFGAGPDAVPLALLAGSLGWIVSLCDASGRAGTRRRFAGVDEIRLGSSVADLAAEIGHDSRAGFAIVMSHSYETDRDTLSGLLRSHARYIGVLGPARRTQRMLAELGARPDRRVHAPIGLALGAETPAEIALAISSEIQAVLTGAPGGHLRDRAGSIHERRPESQPLASAAPSRGPSLVP